MPAPTDLTPLPGHFFGGENENVHENSFYDESLVNCRQMCMNMYINLFDAVMFGLTMRCRAIFEQTQEKLAFK